MYYLLRRNLSTITRRNKCSNIRYTNKQICKKCINFIPEAPSFRYDDDDNRLGRCRKFGEQNLVTGKIEYEMAITCRHNETKCGIDGIHYVQIIKL